MLNIGCLATNSIRSSRDVKDIQIFFTDELKLFNSFSVDRIALFLIALYNKNVTYITNYAVKSANKANSK
jgi:hypothetical protein